ncbi:MAG TPA: cytidylate kinase-like family protein [Pyrinomonadaceae bacterium]|jgi:cytidylate kinase|nr:cytidylate kinase-like family protein [Pyrinomonadaceae bacterium]
MESRITITIARQMGSGGSFLGQVIANRLQIKYVDREVLRLAAQSLGVEEEAVVASSERIISLWERFFGGLTVLPPESHYTPPPVRTFSDEELFEKQVEALKLIAPGADCVIVGYGAAFVLPHHSRMVNFYFHAPGKFRIRRIMQLYELKDPHEARRLMEESDSMRRKFFERMTGRDWACADNYHLSLDTSIYPLEELAERLVIFIQRKLGSVTGGGKA